MAPRTREQQDAYNAKRRAETAAKRKAKTNLHLKNTSKVAREAKAARQEHVEPKNPQHVANGKAGAEVRKATRPRVHAPVDETAAQLEKLTGVKEPKPTPAPMVVSEPNKPVVHAPQEGSPVQHTMARSYVRGGSAGQGKLRGKTYQATVSFTAEQMPQVIAAAQFRGVSLAEMIRSCVVAHLNRGQTPT